MYFVYILFLINNNLYTGVTGNLKQRLNDHLYGKVKSTRNFRPLKLIHYEVYTLESDAKRREKFLKTTEGKRLLKQQIRDILEKSRKGG